MGSRKRKYDLSETSMRDAVLAQLEKFGVTRADLAKHGGCSCTESTVFRFLAGSRSTLSENVEEILQAAGLQLVEANGRPEWLEEVA